MSHPIPQAEPGCTIKLGRVLAHKAGGKFTVGQPYLGAVTVEALVLEELKGPKLIVSRAPLHTAYDACPP